MRPLDLDAPLFPSRLDAGEDLYFKKPLGPQEPRDALLVVASDGGVEVAWPWAYLCLLPVLRVDPGALAGLVPLTTGRAVAVVDDGLLAADAWSAVLRAVSQAGPRTLVAVAPALRAPARRAVRQAGVDAVRTLRPTTQADGHPSFYAQRPARPAVAASLLAQVRWDRPRGPARDEVPMLRVVGL